MASMVVFMVASATLMVALEAAGVPAMDKSQAVLSANGKVLGVEKGRRGIIRRDDSNDDDTQGEELLQTQSFHGVSGAARERKVALGLATKFAPSGSAWAIAEGPHANMGDDHTPWHTSPKWALHKNMPKMPSCTQDVTTDMGLSDYGTMDHSCTACQRECTDENKAGDTRLTYKFEPSLEECNARDVHVYINWTDIGKLGCTDCKERGLQHRVEFSVATKAGQDVKAYENQTLSFEGWMGPEVLGGPRGSDSDFQGFHVFEVRDTLEPHNSSDCDAKPRPGRWITLAGGVRRGETFTCKRICTSKSEAACKCGRNTAVRCTAPIAMTQSQIFKYRVRMINGNASGTLDPHAGINKPYVGTEWEVTAVDLTDSHQTEMTVGRIILSGNDASSGIKDVRQAHSHVGCVPCDLFYESTVVTGPFINEPPLVHHLVSAEGVPPELTSDSCELFRVSSLGGYAVKFETGPGIWPPFEVNDTILTCEMSEEVKNNTGRSTCETFVGR